MCGAAKLFDSSEQAFETCRVMLKELKGKEKQLTLQYFYKEKKTQQNIITFFWGGGGGQLFVDFRISRGSWES